MCWMIQNALVMTDSRRPPSEHDILIEGRAKTWALLPAGVRKVS